MTFAEFYDLMLEDIDYNIFLDTFHKYLKTTCKIVDLGCGTGSFLTVLLDNNYNAFGIDNDKEMLDLAYKKLSRKDVLFYHDINEEIDIKADVFFMLFDVINFNSDYKNIFKNIYQALNNNGILIFDFYKNNIARKYKNYAESDENYKWQIETKANVMIHNLEFYNNKKTVTQYIHNKKDIIKTLKALNFKYKFIKGPDKRKHYLVCFKVK